MGKCFPRISDEKHLYFAQLQHIMTINVICRKDAVNKDGKVPIIFLFIHERKAKKVSTGIYVALKHWDLEKQCPTPNCPNREEIQFQLSTQLHAYKKKMQQLEVLDIPITFDTLLKERKPKNLTTVGEFFNQIIQRLEQVERYGTASNYKITVSLLEQFHSLNIRFEEINLQFLREFEAFLRQRGNMSNSIATKFTCFKAMYNRAIAEDIFTPEKNPFQQFKVGRLWENTQKRAITKEDIHALMALDLSNRTYYTRFSRDIFMFSYLMAGINFKDIALLKWVNIVNGHIYYNRKKTGKVMNCKLSTEALRIIERYSKTHAQDGYTRWRN